MVGHTGDIEATVVACKAADEAVKVWSITFVTISSSEKKLKNIFNHNTRLICNFNKILFLEYSL